MKFAIIGLGGVGGYLGGMLLAGGEDVTFVSSSNSYQHLKEKGFSLESVEGNFNFPSIKVLNCASKLDAPDIVFVCTKTYDLELVAKSLSESALESSIIIPILNGIDNDIRLKSLLPKGKVYPGLTYIVSTKTAPGLIEQTAGPRTFYFGDRTQPHNQELEEIAACLQQSNIKATASEDISRDLWTKFIWIVTFAGMTAICRASIGEIVNDENTFELYLRVLDEAIEIARADGFRLNDERRAKIVEKSEHYKTQGQGAKSSLLVDLENKRRTEIESLNGKIVRIAKKHQVSAPLNELIYTAIKTAEKDYMHN